MAINNIIGLVIGDKTREWTILSRDKAHWSISASERVDVVLSVSEDIGRESSPVEEIPDQLKKTINRFSSYITLACPVKMVLLRVIEIPLVSEDELDGVVRLQADKFSPFPSEVMVISYEIIEKLEDKMRVLIACAKEESINEFTAALRNCGIMPHRIDVDILAKWHLLKTKGKIATAGREFIIIFSNDALEIIVHDNGVPFMFRYLDLTGYEAGTESPENYISEEIQRIMLAAEMERGLTETSSMIIYPDKENNTLIDVFNKTFSCEIKVGDAGDLRDISTGVALRSAYADRYYINLVPHHWQTTALAYLFKKRVITASVIMFVIWLLLMVVVFGGIAINKWRLTALNNEAAKLSGPANEVRAVRRKVWTMKKYLNNNFSALEYLREICELLPAGIELSQFSYRKGESLRISGSAQNVEQVYDFRRKMDRSPLLKENTLGGTSLDSRRGAYLFEMDVKLPGEEQL